MRFRLTETIKEFTHIEDKYGYVEVKKPYECSTYDDLQNIFLTLVDYSTDKLRLEVDKIEEADD